MKVFVLAKQFAVGSLFGILYLGGDCLVHLAARRWTGWHLKEKTDSEKKSFLLGVVAAAVACLSLIVRAKEDNTCYLKGDVFN